MKVPMILAGIFLSISLINPWPFIIALIICVEMEGKQEYKSHLSTQEYEQIEKLKESNNNE